MVSADVGLPLVFYLFFYALFSILYVAVQKWSNKEIRQNTIIIGGAATTIIAVIVISISEGPPSGEMSKFFVFWGAVIIVLLKFLAPMFKVREKKEPSAAATKSKIQKTVELIKSGVKHESISIRVATLLVLLWILFMLRSIYFAFLNGSLGMTPVEIITGLIIVSSISIFAPFIILCWYLESKKSIPPKPEEGIEEPEPSKEVELTPEPPAPAPKPQEKIEPKPPKKSGPMKSCPYCKGKLSELNYFKLKSGNDASCEYCGEIISS